MTSETKSPVLSPVVPGAGETKTNGHAAHAPGKVVNRPTFLKSKNGKYRFLIMDAPTEQNLSQYIEVLKKKKVKALVRACEPSYSTDPLTKEGFRVVELAYADGDPPPADIVQKWLALVSQVFDDKDNKESAIAVHCVAGLGRAPVLVAIALIESGMEPLDAIAFIRKKRKGAINARQIKYIEAYTPSTKGCCVIL